MLSPSLVRAALLASLSITAPVLGWSHIRTDGKAWQSACGHVDRAGAVCINARYGSKWLFSVQDNARQNVAFSADGKALLAYCPNLDKGEKPYELKYGSGDTAVYYKLLGRPSSQRCCNTQYTVEDNSLAVNNCIEPSVGAKELFPYPNKGGGN